MQGRYTRTLIAALGAILFASSAIAQDWTVARMTGAAWVVGKDAERVPVSAGMPVASGATLATGPRTRAMLVRGKDTMMLGPNTVVGVPRRADRGLKTTVLHQLGTVALTVEKRQAPHFSVQTPYLAAIVKGTEFTVTVTPAAAEVAVATGLVQVIDLASGSNADIGAGGKASAAPGRGPGLTVSGRGAPPTVRQGRPRKPVVAPFGGKGGDSAQSNDNNGRAGQAGSSSGTARSRPEAGGQGRTGKTGSSRGDTNGSGGGSGVDVGGSVGGSVGGGSGVDIGGSIGGSVGGDDGVSVGGGVGGSIGGGGVEVGGEVSTDLGGDLGVDVGGKVGVDTDGGITAEAKVDVGGIGVDADVGLDLGGGLGGALGGLKGALGK